MGRGQQMNSWDVERSLSVDVTSGKDSLRKRRTVLLVIFLAVLFSSYVASSYMYSYSIPDASKMFLQRRPTSSDLISTVVEDNENAAGPTLGFSEKEDSTSSQDVKGNIVASDDGSNNDQQDAIPGEGNTDAMAENTEVAIHVNETSSTLEVTPEVSSQDVNDTMVGSDTTSQLGVVDTENTGDAMAEKEVKSASPNSDDDWKQRQDSDEEPNDHQHVISMESPSKGVCDLGKGSWVPDSRPPQYTNSTCWFIQEHQNCIKNGRPDMGYLHWKWQPEQCDLPRIDAAAFLSNMRDKSMYFVGDSLSRNQFQSLLCLLSQAERPDHTYQKADDKDNIYVFPSHNFTLAIFASTHLVHVEDKLVTWPDNSTLQVAHIHLDKLDRAWVDRVPGVDFLQLSTGQWWFKRALFYVNGTPIGCHWWEGDGYMFDDWKECTKVIGFGDPYRMAIHNALQGSLALPGYTGTTVFRSFAPDHFEDGRWHNGGRCVRTSPGGVPMRDLTRWMREIQLQEFQNVTGALSAGEKMRIRLLDITHLAQIRADGHPDAYRNFQPFSKESKQPVQKDCLHWCLPGPIDTWNDLLVGLLEQNF